MSYEPTGMILVLLLAMNIMVSGPHICFFFFFLKKKKNCVLTIAVRPFVLYLGNLTLYENCFDRVKMFNSRICLFEYIMCNRNGFS
ncbi:hypothetical protein CLU79DRAFT_757114 [Phycomyces nitens]|nr:hypothetical protein CLU79DRAFT_757114 [Phycomyces nitens]